MVSISFVNACLKIVTVEILFKLTVDSEGRVVKVQFLKDQDIGDELKGCLKQKLMAMKFPSSAGHQDGEAAITLRIA